MYSCEIETSFSAFGKKLWNLKSQHDITHFQISLEAIIDYLSNYYY